MLTQKLTTRKQKQLAQRIYGESLRTIEALVRARRMAAEEVQKEKDKALNNAIDIALNYEKEFNGLEQMKGMLRRHLGEDFVKREVLFNEKMITASELTSLMIELQRNLGKSNDVNSAREALSPFNRKVLLTAEASQEAVGDQNTLWNSSFLSFSSNSEEPQKRCYFIFGEGDIKNSSAKKKRR